MNIFKSINKKHILYASVITGVIVAGLVYRSWKKKNTSTPAVAQKQNDVGYILAYQYAVDKQNGDLKKFGRSDINLANPDTWPSLVS